jgi:hypothetical protein
MDNYIKQEEYCGYGSDYCGSHDTYIKNKEKISKEYNIKNNQFNRIHVKWLTILKYSLTDKNNKINITENDLVFKIFIEYELNNGIIESSYEDIIYLLDQLDLKENIMKNDFKIIDI